MNEYTALNYAQCQIDDTLPLRQFNNLSKADRWSICGNVIENVESWPHLRHVITNYSSDKLDIISRRNKFIGQANNVICWFNKLDCYTKTRLLKS